MKVTDILSVYLLAAGMGWLSAQIVKYMIQATKTRSWRNISSLYKSGNMPSVHTATVIALTTAVALRLGINSAMFATALVLALIVTYDAMQVRRSVGEQGEALNKLLRAHSKSAKLPYYSSGHTPLEVLAGDALGVMSGSIIVICATYFSFLILTIHLLLR